MPPPGCGLLVVTGAGPGAAYKQGTGAVGQHGQHGGHGWQIKRG